MIEDMKHLPLIEDMNRQLQDLLVRFNEKRNGKTDKMELCELLLERNAALVAWLKDEKRTLEFWQGKKIEPEAHYGEAVLIGVMGGGT